MQHCGKRISGTVRATSLRNMCDRPIDHEGCCRRSPIDPMFRARWLKKLTDEERAAVASAEAASTGL